MNETNERNCRLARLMCSAQDGDSAAYTECLREIAPLVRQSIRQRRRFLQPQDVEDLVQDVLLSVHAARATYDPSRPFLPWLMAITHNRMVDRARRYARMASSEVAVDEFPETFSSETPNIPEEAYGEPEALRRAVQELPAGQRTAIEMLKLKEMSLKEASAASGMSIGALKVAAHRGLKALRKALGARV